MVSLERATGVEAYKAARVQGRNRTDAAALGTAQFFTPVGYTLLIGRRHHFRPDAYALDVLSTGAFLFSLLSPPFLLLSGPAKIAANLYSNHLNE